MYDSHEGMSVVNPNEVALKMKLDYSRGVKDHSTKALEAVCELCWNLVKPDLNADECLREAAELISKLFAIESVAIGVRDPADRKYKYKAVIGLDKEVADGFMDLSYTKDQLLDPSKYPSHDISAHTKLFLSEDHPYTKEEEFTYRRPGMIGMKRRTISDSLEADYLDIFFNGSDREVLGFIEISGTRMRKLPDSTAIKWIELIGGLLGVVMQKRVSY